MSSSFCYNRKADEQMSTDIGKNHGTQISQKNVEEKSLGRASPLI